MLIAFFVPILLVLPFFLEATGLVANKTTALIVLVVAITLSLLQLVPNLMVAIKRLHDRNKSGWWLLFFIVPPQLLEFVAGQLFGNEPISYVLRIPAIVVTLWMIVELGFLRGTIGPNRFGDDPLSSHKEATSD
jgi:uncharacterized membrane protein YhaH (DUF805 family)